MIFTKICVGCISRETDTRAWAISFLFWGGMYVFFFPSSFYLQFTCIALFWFCVLICQLLCSTSSSAYWIAYLHATDNNKNLYRLPPHPLFAWCNNNNQKERKTVSLCIPLAWQRWNGNTISKYKKHTHKKILKIVRSEWWQGEICLLTCSTQTLVVRIWFFRSCKKKNNSMKEKRTKIFDSRENWKWKTQIESDSFFSNIFTKRVYNNNLLCISFENIVVLVTDTSDSLSSAYIAHCFLNE